MASTVATVNLSSKKFYCYREGEEIYILYNQLLEHFQLKNTSSPSTLQRKKNVVVPSDPYCPVYFELPQGSRNRKERSQKGSRANSITGY